MIPTQVREELNALSKEVFGSSSRWQKLMNKGYIEAVTEEATELVPGEKEGDEPTERKVKVPLKTATGINRSEVKRHTVESVREFMLERKKQIDEIRELIRKQQDEAKAKKEQAELNKRVQQEAAGSAV